MHSVNERVISNTVRNTGWLQLGLEDLEKKRQEVEEFYADPGSPSCIRTADASLGSSYPSGMQAWLKAE